MPAEFKLEEFAEEQQAAITAEIDRRVTSAVQTATKKVTEQLTTDLTHKLESDYERKMQAAIAEAQAQATMTEEEKIKNLADQLAQKQEEFNKTQLTYKAERKLRDAGMADEAIDQLVPLIVAGSTQDTLDTALSSFVATQQAAVEAALQAQKENLASNATLPASSGGKVSPQDPNAVVNTILSDDSLDPRFAQASGIQVLLDQAVADATGAK